MNKKQRKLAEKRERLVAQISAQRVTLAQNFETWRMPLAFVDQGLSALRKLGRHPEWIAGVVVLLVVIKPKHVLKWFGRGWGTWQIINKLRGR